MKLLVAAGGTGGHVFPALAVADEAVRRQHDVLVLLGGVKTRIPKKFQKFKILRLHAGRNPMKLGIGLARAAAILSDFERIDRIKIVATGSYAVFPILSVATAFGIKFYLLEQNRVPGRVVHLFAPFARAVCSTFPKIGLRKEIWTGNPTLRRNPIPKLSAKKRLGLEPEDFVVFVVGGSLGALKLAEVGYKTASLVPNAFFLIQTGGRFTASERPNVRLFDFIDDMELFYSAADIMVARAGGGTIAEAAIFGLPTIFVPYPFATDRHQHKNAEFIASIGGAIVIDQSELTPERLAKLLKDLSMDRSKLQKMSESISKFARPNAAEHIVKILERGC